MFLADRVALLGGGSFSRFDLLCLSSWVCSEFEVNLPFYCTGRVVERFPPGEGAALDDVDEGVS